MSDQQAQELTAAERKAMEAVVSSTAYPNARAREIGCFKAGLAARPVQVERPDEDGGGSYADASPLRKRASDALKGFRAEADDPLGRLALADRVLAAARLSERPGEGELHAAIGHYKRQRDENATVAEELAERVRRDCDDYAAYLAAMEALDTEDYELDLPAARLSERPDEGETCEECGRKGILEPTNDPEDGTPLCLTCATARAFSEGRRDAEKNHCPNCGVVVSRPADEPCGRCHGRGEGPGGMLVEHGNKRIACHGSGRQPAGEGVCEKCEANPVDLRLSESGKMVFGYSALCVPCLAEVWRSIEGWAGSITPGADEGVEIIERTHQAHPAPVQGGYEAACECGHAPARHRVADDDGGPGPCRDCDCIVYEEAPAEPVRCVSCGRVRRPDGPLCPRCGSELSEAVDECDVAEGDWVEAH